jgi:threonine dehydratase
MGSSICGVVAARNALDLSTEIVGVTAVANAATASSFRQRKLVEAPANSQIADGLACRRPNQDALDIIFANVARIVEVSDAEIADAMSICHQDTHNIAEGAGAAALAAALKEKSSLRGKRAGIILTGGNVDRELYVAVLTGEFQSGAFQTGAFQTGASKNRPLQSGEFQTARHA